MKADRRQFTRYIVNDNGFEVFSYDTKIIGKLKNISKGGLAYQYQPITDEKAEFKIIDIMGTGPDQFYLPAIACKTIYDLSELAHDGTFRGKATRVRGLQYVRLSKRQKRKLEFLLDNYAIEPSDNHR